MIRPAADAPLPACGAFLAWSSFDEARAGGNSGGTTVTYHVAAIEETAACGRFAVDDGTGVALVDDDCFVLTRIDRRWPRPFGDDTLAVLDGAEIEVAGYAIREPVADDVRTSPQAAGYRDATEMLRFEGSSEAPVVLLV